MSGRTYTNEVNKRTIDPFFESIVDPSSRIAEEKRSTLDLDEINDEEWRIKGRIHCVGAEKRMKS